MICHEPQWYVVPPQLVASTSAPAPTETAAMPRKSMRGRAPPGMLGMLVFATRITMMASGTLT